MTSSLSDNIKRQASLITRARGDGYAEALESLDDKIATAPTSTVRDPWVAERRKLIESMGRKP